MSSSASSAPTAASPVLSLPYIAVQPSAPLVIRDLLAPHSQVAAEDCWVSCYRAPTSSESADGQETQSVHGRFRLAEGDDEGTVEVLKTDERVQVTLNSTSGFTVSCPSLSIPPTAILLPSPFLDPLLPSPGTSTNSTSQDAPAPCLAQLRSSGGIDCFALSPDGRRVVLGGRDGRAQVVEVVEVDQQPGGKALRKGKETALRGHSGDLTAVEFFPSSEVILSGSSDMSLRVFSAVDGTSPRELTGHTKRVTAVSILRSPSPSGPHKGRSCLSAALDGTLKLWDIASAACVRSWALRQPVTALAVFHEGEEDTQDVTKGKVALAAHADGTVSRVDLSASASSSSPADTPNLLQTSSASALDTIDTLALPDGRRAIAVGSRAGVVALFVLPDPSSPPASLPLVPMASWQRTTGGSSVRAVALCTRSATSSEEQPGTLSVLVAPSDGLPYRAFVDLSAGGTDESAQVTVVEEFVGLDCEPATGVREDRHGRVWISGGGADGGLRVYERGKQ
ncbi:hypothetical protein JCM10207_002148 [Rhodosporidiobolus poonsookiae]